MDKLEDQEEHMEQECSASGQRGGDDNTGVRKRRGEELHEEDVRRVLQKVSKYDVFLNHRGVDLKKTFVSDLYAALRRTGREPFLDAKSLEKGHHAFKSINEALSGVLVHIAIFSPRYAESKYCLDELCDMLASKKTLIPVFYNVEPENLRWPENEKGPFAKAFSHHMERKRNQDVERWKRALKASADITGFRLVDCDNEVKLVEEIVAAVLKAIPMPPSMAPAYHQVGLKETSKYVVNMLHHMGNNVGVIGIYGMGGIGKTTLAKVVYNQEQSRFENKCFLKDVKDAKGIAVMDLQTKMVKDLLGENVKQDYAQCIEIIQKMKLLLVVDDISEAKQFYDLIPNIKQLAPGSRVLITSRASDILNKIMSDVPQHVLYPMPQLSFPNALELFTWCAFSRKSLDEVDSSFHDNVKNITHACGGIPLALEVMGGFLADKKDQPKCWTEATSALRNNGDIMTSFKISYNGLVNEDDKYMFVDIACFMLGQSKHVALAIWNSLGEYSSPSWSLNRLIDKCLVSVDTEGFLRMHDLLRDMGRNVIIEIARQNREVQSYIWDSLQASKVIKKRQGSWDKILALSLIGTNPSKTWQAKSFAKMIELRYLLSDGCLINGNFSRWSEELRWLQWRYFPHEGLPLTLNLPNLVVLNLANSLLTYVWNKSFEECPCQELEILNLSKCIELKELPQDIKKLVKLKFLNLEGCSSLSSLPDSLGGLTALEHLDLSHCSSLTTLPNLSCLGSLQVLKLNWCVSLSKVPESLGILSNLEELWVNGCELLQKLPSSFSKLSKLAVLDLGGTALRELPEDIGQLRCCKEAVFRNCKSLIQLPESFGSLSNLELLILHGCQLLEELPSSFFKLWGLTILDLGETSLSKLPEDFGRLGGLKKALFQNCKSLVQLPESFGTLSNLEELRLTGCVLLQKLPASFSKLSKLTILYLRETAIRELPEDFGQLGDLKEVNFRDCKSLIQLPESFGSLSNLEELELHGCEVLQKLPGSFSKLSKLKILNLTRTALTQLPENLGQLSGLKEAYLEYCKSLIQLPESFGSLSNLEVLELNGCELLQKLPASFSKLYELTILNLTGTSLTQLPEDFGQLRSLIQALFLNCKCLLQLPESFGSLSNLQELRLNGCERLRELPSSFFKLSKLTLLDLGETSLAKLPKHFGQLCSLEKAIFLNCKSLIQLPGPFGSLSNLEEISLNGCELLQQLPISFFKLSKLMILNLGATALRELPEDFGQLGSLKKAYFQDCKSLVQLPESFGSLSNLEEMWLDGCVFLQKLPSSFHKLSKLKVLALQCTALEELPEDFGHLSSLEKVYFSFCKNLRLLSTSFSGLSNLEVLHLDGCKLLQELPPSICLLNKLGELCLNYTGLTELPEEFGQLQNLTQADFEGCNLLNILCESFACLGKLHKLNLRGCRSLIQLPETFSNLSSLENLDLRGCRLLQTYPSSTERLCVQVDADDGDDMQVVGDGGGDSHGDGTDNGSYSSSSDPLNFWSWVKELKRLWMSYSFSVCLKSGVDEGMKLDLKRQCEEFCQQMRLSHAGNAERGKLIQDLVDLLAAAYPHHNVMLVHTPHSQNLHDCTHLELKVSACGYSFIFQLYVFKHGDFTLHGDGGDINWAFAGNFHRDSKNLTFYNR